MSETRIARLPIYSPKPTEMRLADRNPSGMLAPPRSMKPRMCEPCIYGQHQFCVREMCPCVHRRIA